MSRSSKNSLQTKSVAKIKIGPLHYDVLRRPVPVTEGESGNVLGRVVYEESKIVVANNLSKENEMLTIFHEAFHALMWHCGVKDQDERFVETASGFLFDMIRDNPKLIAAIQATA